MKQRKRIWIAFLAAVTLLFFGCAMAGASTSPSEFPDNRPAEDASSQKDAETIVILHTNDVHCALDDNIGYDGLSLYRKEMLQDYENVLLVDAGDAIQGGVYGSLSRGSLIIDLMNDVGYDCAIPGNHEFDYGFEVIDDLSEQLKCGYICANFCTADGEPVFPPYRIITAGKKKIAFIGVDTPDTFTKSTIHTLIDDQGMPVYDFMADEAGDRLVECLQNYVDEVRAKGADIVILLSHLGNGESTDRNFTSREVIRRTNGIDLLIDGHSHDLIEEEMVNKDGKKIPAGQTGTKLSAIGKITIAADHAIKAELITDIPEPKGFAAESVSRGGKQVWVDAVMNRRIEELKAGYADQLNEKIGELTFDLSLESPETGKTNTTRETPMCSLTADAIREIAGSDIALVGGASVRNGLQSGTVVYRDIANALPYMNDIVVVSMKGKDILDALEFGARLLPGKNNAFLQVSGLEYTIDLSVPSSAKEDAKRVFQGVEGDYRVRDVLIQGTPLDPEREYTVASYDFLYGGGDGMSMFANGELLRYAMTTDTDALALYIGVNLMGKVPETYAEPSGRIKIINE